MRGFEEGPERAAEAPRVAGGEVPAEELGQEEELAFQRFRGLFLTIALDSILWENILKQRRMSAVVFSARAPQIRLVGQKIRQIRKSRHLTQSDLAARIGITQSDLSRMENGEYKVGLDTLFRILQVFELSMSQFFNEPAADEASAAAAPAGAREPGTFAEEPELARDWESLVARGPARGARVHRLQEDAERLPARRPRRRADERPPAIPAPLGPLSTAVARNPRTAWTTTRTSRVAESTRAGRPARPCRGPRPRRGRRARTRSPSREGRVRRGARALRRGLRARGPHRGRRRSPTGSTSAARPRRPRSPPRTTSSSS